MTDLGAVEVAEQTDNLSIPRDFAEIGTRPQPDGVLRVFDNNGDEVQGFDITTAPSTPYLLMRTESLRPDQEGYDPEQPRHRKLAEWDDPADNPRSTIGRIDYFYDHGGRIIAEREVEVPKASLPHLTIPELSQVKSVKVYKYTTDPAGKIIQQLTTYARDISDPTIIATSDLGPKRYGRDDVYYVNTD